MGILSLFRLVSSLSLATGDKSLSQGNLSRFEAQYLLLKLGNRIPEFILFFLSLCPLNLGAINQLHYVPWFSTLVKRIMYRVTKLLASQEQ